MTNYFDFSRIEDNIFFNSVASLESLFPSFVYSSLFVSTTSLNQYADSFASFRDIFILIIKSFLLNASLAFYPVKSLTFATYIKDNLKLIVMEYIA